jgi:membrane associated rhomboid family serine protease
VSDLPYDRENYCYRHPDRQSFVLCQRCGRTVCSSCQTQASVGVHCPECVKEARAAAPKQRPAAVRAARAWRSGTDRPLATFAVIGLMAIVFLVGLLLPAVLNALAYFPALTLSQPWSLVTYTLVHISPFSVLIDGIIMYLIGHQIEQLFGRRRFIVLFLITALAGAVTVIVFVPGGAVFGAGPVIWGMFGAILIYTRSQGGNVTGLLIMLGLFLILGFVLRSMWQANVGGLVAGAAVTAVYLRYGAIRQKRQRTYALLGIAGALVAIAAIAFVRF